MIRIQTKRVYETEDQTDGFRILVDRLWPRGIKKENLHYDLWAKNMTPSAALRQWFHQDKEKNWSDFKQKYVRELDENPETESFLNIIKEHKKVTLLYASQNTASNHANILRDYLTVHLK